MLMIMTLGVVMVLIRTLGSSNGVDKDFGQ